MNHIITVASPFIFFLTVCLLCIAYFFIATQWTTTFRAHASRYTGLPLDKAASYLCCTSSLV